MAQKYRNKKTTEKRNTRNENYTKKEEEMSIQK
jgi:hypothetical protein